MYMPRENASQLSRSVSWVQAAPIGLLPSKAAGQAVPGRASRSSAASSRGAASAGKASASAASKACVLSLSSAAPSVSHFLPFDLM